MTARHDLERQVSSWLQSEMSTSAPPGLLEAIQREVEVTPRRAATGTFLPIRTFAALGAALPIRPWLPISSLLPRLGANGSFGGIGFGGFALAMFAVATVATAMARPPMAFLALTVSRWRGIGSGGLSVRRRCRCRFAGRLGLRL